MKKKFCEYSFSNILGYIVSALVIVVGPAICGIIDLLIKTDVYGRTTIIWLLLVAVVCLAFVFHHMENIEYLKDELNEIKKQQKNKS